MSFMMILSLALNIAVLVPVCAGLLLDSGWAQDAWGAKTPARGILLSIYGAILAISALLLALGSVVLAVPLLAVQILYKVTTPFTVGRLGNPVVLSNLAIAAVHGVTLAMVWRDLNL